jgi:hypothetical protein
MPTTRSQKPKSLHGTNGPDVESLDEEKQQESPTPVLLKQEEQQAPEPAVAVVEDSGEKRKPSVLSAEDKSSRIKMTKQIAKYLGLSGKSRSIEL